LKPAADLALGLGVLCAIASCCTGLLLSRSGDYDPDLVNIHQWLAISLTVVTAILYGQLNGRPATRTTQLLSGASLVLIFATGHFGGSLTHGPGYLTTDLVKKPQPPALKPVADVQNAVLYNDMVAPVLHDNCYGCHSGGRSKGGLRLDDPANILKGGKDGPVIVAGDTGGSLLLKRILLPLDNDHHMAPREKPQLTTAEVKLIRWWISSGASFDRPVAQLPQDNDIHAVLAAFHDGTAGPVASSNAPTTVADSDMPATPIKPAPSEALKRLSAAGARVLPIAAGSNYLRVSFPNDSIGRDALGALVLIREQLVELKCSDLPLGDSVVVFAASCPHLVRLWLDHTKITGKDLGRLDTLGGLRYLNLTSTAVDEAGVRALANAKKLREIYLYQTNISKSAWPALQAVFPHTVLDSGGYHLTKLTSDTAIVRLAPQKK
jgi:mono/diheme cytochrome c family protein